MNRAQRREIYKNCKDHKANAYIDLDGTPKLEICLCNMDRFQQVLKRRLDREPTTEELFDFVKTEKSQ